MTTRTKLRRCGACGETFVQEVMGQFEEPDGRVVTRYYKRCPECRPRGRRRQARDVAEMMERGMGERLAALGRIDELEPLDELEG